MILSVEQIESISDNISVESLPGDLPEIALFVGVKKALLVARRMSGQFYLARWVADTDRWSKDTRILVDIVGREDAEKIARHFCGAHVNIQLCTGFWRRIRNQAIIQALGKHRMVDLARMFQVSERHIRRIRAAFENEEEAYLHELHEDSGGHAPLHRRRPRFWS